MQKGFPYNGRPILTQYKHDSRIGGKLIDQDAMDFAPTLTMKLLGLIGIYLPREAKIVQVVTRTNSRDGWIAYQTRDGCIHYRVHCLFRASLKMNKWYPMGTRIGTMDRKPIYATGMHDHHFILKAGKPVDIIGWYGRRGIKDWFRDPYHLTPRPIN